ncbi:MAG: hypothetical protein F4152_07535 [Dehalococcoidia bacterium]|nr:hypothetical protein [Dehalococcoidia bacterium]
MTQQALPGLFGEGQTGLEISERTARHSMTSITETIGRSALLAAASNYQSVAEALMELIDNPFDKRRGRQLTIDVKVDKKRNRVTITDIGGAGMNDEGLQGWIRWGEGETHSTADIGQYHVGGKLAAVYLAEGLEIVCRKSGESSTWRFSDPHWGSRIDALKSSPLSQVDEGQLRWRGSGPERGDGFTRVTLHGLKPHRYEVGILRERLSDTYRSLIEQGSCTIVVDGKAIGTRKLPWSSSVEVVEIPRQEVSPGVYVLGRVGAIDRDQVPDGRGVRIPAGVRTEFNGRKITDGEEFGFKLSGKGNLQRVYGEITIQGRGLKPNQLKNGWPHDSQAWAAVEQFVHERMQPVVSHLNNLTDARPASREEKKRANSARRRVQAALQRLQRLRTRGGNRGIGRDEAPGGRKPPEPSKARQRTVGTRRTRGATTNPTPPPSEAVGRLLRRVNGMPSVLYDHLGEQTPRTQWREQEDGARAVVVNKDYPLYVSLGGNEDYVFESLVTHLVYDEASSVRDARDLFDQLVWLDKAHVEVAA